MLRLRNDLYYVGWGVKLYSLTHHSMRNALLAIIHFCTVLYRCSCFICLYISTTNSVMTMTMIMMNVWILMT